MKSALVDKAAKGARWSFADSIINQGISFLIGIVLARLLSPDEYGLIGIITIFISISNFIVDSGLSNALIRKKDADDADYNTVFYLNFGLSIVLFLTLYVCAPLISDFFGRDELTALSRVMGVIVIINAFSLIQKTILTKRVDFKLQTKISLASSIVSGIVGIGMAIMGCGVWSLVGQQISRQLLIAVLFWIYNKWRPSLTFSVERFKDLFGFSWKLLVSGMIDTIWTEIYQVVIGKCYSPQDLGQYTRSKQFANLFSSNLNSVVQRVSYPVLSSIQDERERLKNAYRKIIKLTMLVTFPCMIGLAATSQPFIYVLIGEKWAFCAKMLPFICFNMMLFPLHSINLNMLMVSGRSDLFLKLEIVKKIIAVVPLLLGIYIGIMWMLAGSIVAGMISFVLNSMYSGKLVGYSCFAQIKDIAPTFLSALLMGICVYCLQLLPVSYYIILPCQVILGMALFYLFCRVLRLQEFFDFKELAFESFKKIRKK